MELDALYRRSVEGWVARSRGRRPTGPARRRAATGPCVIWSTTSSAKTGGRVRSSKGRRSPTSVTRSTATCWGTTRSPRPERQPRTPLAAVAERLPDGGKVHLSYGDEDLGEYLRQLVADHLIHGWDLAAATGQDRALDPEVTAEVAAWFHDREAMYRSAGIVAERPASSPDGNPQADLLIAFGRDPDVGRLNLARSAYSGPSSRKPTLSPTW